MQRILAAALFALFAAGLSTPAFSQASFTAKDAAGATQTFKSINCSATICPLSVLTDTAGAAIYGTAGTANANILTVQGIASMTPLLATVTFASAQPVTQSGNWTARVVGNAGAVFDGATGAAVPANVLYMGINSGGNLAGWNGTVQPGNTANTTPWLFSPSTGGNTAAVKAASTAPVASDPALVVAISPNSVNANGPATGANSAPTVTATDQTGSCTGVIAINQTASTDLKTSVAKLNICSVVLVSASAQNISLVEGTGSVCATGIAALVGGTTASVAVAANGGFSAVSSVPWLKTQTTADHLCLLQSGAGNVSGVITYLDHS